jgi:arabinofuranosyltransferase
MGQALTSTPAARVTKLPLVVAAVVMLLVSLAAIRQATVVIDHQRYYYLDDDQMISMRYARNLVDGLGLVWNAGDRVEGYTNLGWVFVMAAVHAVGVPERLTCLAVELINIGLAVVILVFTDRLLRRFASPPGWLRLAALGTLALSIDLIYWAVNGFETTLLTVVFLWALTRALDDADRGECSIVTCLLAGMLPIIRSDAADLTALVVAAGFLLGSRRRPWAVVFAALPLAVHLTFRINYYGDWLPNTYYLKVAGRSGLFWGGLGYLKGFLQAYPTLVVLALAAAVTTGDRRIRILLMTCAFIALRIVLVGADMFFHFRFIAPVVPLLIVFAAAGIAAVGERRTAMVLATALFVSTVMVSGITGRQTLGWAVNNGLVQEQVVAGWLINRNSRPESTVLVAAAGAMGYFSHRTAFDMLGKVDREIGHLQPDPKNPFTGHNHYDIDRSLAHKPVFVVGVVSAALARHARVLYEAAEVRAGYYEVMLITNQTFIDRYLPHPVPEPYLLQHNSVFVRDDSPEVARVASWPVVSVETEP